MKVVKPKIPIQVQGMLNRLASDSELRDTDIESALVELADMMAAQDDALVEIAEIIAEGAE